MNEKNSRWCFTAWKEPDQSKMQLFMFLLYQTEYTKDNKIHWQGYVEFIKPRTMSQVKSIFKDKTMHVEPAHKSRERNMMYCLKPHTYAGKRFMFNGPSDVYIERTEYSSPVTSSPQISPTTPCPTWEDLMRDYPDYFNN